MDGIRVLSDEQSLFAEFSTFLEQQTESEKGIVVLVRSIEVSARDGFDTSSQGGADT